MVTIYDIAKKTGFSPATVSKALNNYKGVKKETYDIIMQRVKEMGYTANVNARALVTKKSWLLGVLFSVDLDTGISHPHFSEILHSFQITVGTHGYDVIFVNKDLGGQQMSYLEHCLLRRVDGVLLAANKKYTKEVEDVVASKLPLVSVEAIYDGQFSVISDNHGGVLQAMEYLYSLGHRKIGHIAAPLDSTAGMERFNAYQQFVKEKNLPYNPSYMVEAHEYDYQAGLVGIRKLLEKTSSDLPTAIFCGYDKFAFAAISVLTEQGIRIPEDISIIGFDNLSSAEYIHNGLTTIGQRRTGIGKKAADMLIDLIAEKPMSEKKDIRISTSLMIRRTTARINPNKQDER